MTKIGKEKNMSGNSKLVLQIKEDGKKLDELTVDMKYIQANLISLTVANLYLRDNLGDAHKKLKETSSVVKFIQKHS